MSCSGCNSIKEFEGRAGRRGTGGATPGAKRQNFAHFIRGDFFRPPPRPIVASFAIRNNK